MPWRTANTIGKRVVPSLSSAGGVWRLGEVEEARRDDVWPAIIDPLFPNVSLLLPMDGVNGSTAFADESTNNVSISAVGNAKISTAESKFGGASAAFDGTGDHLSAAYSQTLFDWWTEDFAVEAWVFAASFSGWSDTAASLEVPVLVGNMQPTGGINYWSFGPISDGRLAFYYFNGSGNAHYTTATIPVASWHHVAMTKTLSGITLFIDGIASNGTVSVSGTPQSSNAVVLSIGSADSKSLAGYIDELRITKGVNSARYTANFTPPTGPHPVY